jgi:hypothetical protein
MEQLNFNDRITYLAWKAEWKTAYFAAIAAVRAGKQAFKNEQRKVTVGTINGSGPYALVDGKPLWSYKPYYEALEAKSRLVAEVEKLVTMRLNSRLKSGIQRKKMLEKMGVAA